MKFPELPNIFAFWRQNRKIVYGACAAIAALALISFVRDIPILRLLAAAPQVRTIEDVPYGDDLDVDKHRLDIYLPKAAEKRFPVVIFMHGGFWRAGDRDYYQALTGLYANVGAALAKRGVAVIVPSYRLQPEVKIDDQLADVERAVKWTRANIGRYGGDPESLFLGGHSAGGHLVSLLVADQRHFRAAGINPDWIRGVIAISTVFDLTQMAAASDSKFNEEITYAFFGRDEVGLGNYSPVNYLNGRMPPMLILYGQRDLPFIIKQSRDVARKLLGSGNAVAAVEVAANAHADMVLRFNSAEDNLTDHVMRFIDLVIDNP
jgi:acetyl esterase/lipase